MENNIWVRRRSTGEIRICNGIPYGDAGQGMWANDTIDGIGRNPYYGRNIEWGFVEDGVPEE